MTFCYIRDTVERLDNHNLDHPYFKLVTTLSKKKLIYDLKDF
ncbi:hypothetical protein P689_12243 [Candidatus Riesia pediculischaeffi PTSU]|uniref:Uncharacterized protein n=1 Tax=Candidatus Riesia pediculischaeffi PTSU TaxID=1401651 RepID=A0A0C1V627_9ENTR|nr:hypothetical protein P689_12243 [Candidatus Riesia pediculischaeffi PTSU]